MSKSERPLANDRLLRFPKVREKTGLSGSTIWRLEQRDLFPRRRRIAANAVGWPESEIDEWIDEPDPPGVTALCPKCGIDSVIGSASGYPITSNFLWRMKLRWFYGINTLGEVTSPI